jgi:hypothetical protein
LPSTRARPRRDGTSPTPAEVKSDVKLADFNGKWVLWEFWGFW